MTNLESFLDRCQNIDTKEEYRRFIADVKQVNKEPIQLNNATDIIEQAKALICLVAQDTDEIPSHAILDGIFQSDNGMLVAAASLYLISKRADNEAYFKELLLGSDSYHPSKASENARYYLVKFMGLSANTGFIELLYEVLTKHYHFCPQHATVTALENLGENIDEEDIPYTKSLTITKSHDGIIIDTDDKYTGRSECIYCCFFPCKINRKYAGGIQNCKLFDEIDPETAGEILLDFRDWGESLVSQSEEDNEAEKDKSQEFASKWKQACKLMNQKSYLEAIPFLCSALILTEEQTNQSKIFPLAWLYLSRCFSACGEKELEFIALREALNYKGLIPYSKVAELGLLQAFEKNQTIFLDTYEEDIAWSKELDAVNYKQRQQWVRAFDCYVYANICHAGDKAGDWFHIGECCRELGEYHLAELFMRWAIHVINPLRLSQEEISSLSEEKRELLTSSHLHDDSELQEKFKEDADQVHTVLLGKSDPGLSLDRRKSERVPVEPKIEYGFRLDTYQFEEISEAAKEALQYCRGGVSDYFQISRAALERGDLELAIEILKAGVNAFVSDGAKARALHTLALLQIELREYDKAKKYLDWALELKPDDEENRELQEYLVKFRS